MALNQPLLRSLNRDLNISLLRAAAAGGGGVGGVMATAYQDLVNQSASLGGTHKGIKVSPDGTKWITNDTTTNIVAGGTMSTPWDASTATETTSIAQPISDMRGLWTDGTVYCTCSASVVYYGEMSTPWDTSTMGAFSNVTPLSTSNEMADVAFSDDGLTFIVLGFRGDLHSYTCSTPYDLSTLNTTRDATFDLTSISPSIWADDIGAAPCERFAWSADGTQCMLIATVSKQIILLDFATAWDVTTASLNSWNYSAGTSMQGIHWDSAEEKVYVLQSGAIYHLGPEPTPDVSQTQPISGFIQTVSQTMPAGGTGTVTGMALSPDGRHFYNRNTTNNVFREYTLSTPWDFSTATITNTVAEDASIFSPEDMCMSRDGLHMYEIDANEINEWTLSTAWDITSATHTATKVISGGGGISINDDGSKIIVVNDDETIDEITLGTNYDITTATLTNTVTLSPNGGDFDELYDWNPAPNPKFHLFNADGTRFLILVGSRALYEYDVGTPWDMTTLTYTGRSFWFKDAPTGLAWKEDESEIYAWVATNNVNTAVFDSRLA